MSDEWGLTQGIRMSAQSVELQMIGHHGSPELMVTGSLMNIARGSCTLRLKTSPPSGPSGIGHLKIEAMRPVMLAEVTVSQSQFDYLLQTFQGSLPRPATAIFKLWEELSVSVAGDLAIEHDMSCTITDISWVMPLR
ncbi:MAG: hypothetical protein P8M25_20325 [Paracoccaceae bacterium]|jgi:hypothetical protein|nr:hypothetical protein [Paracoccaceae bacterium]